MEWSGPAIRPGLDNRHLIIEGHRGPLDFGFGTWIWDLDLGLGFVTEFGLDNYKTIGFWWFCKIF